MSFIPNKSQTVPYFGFPKRDRIHLDLLWEWQDSQHLIRNPIQNQQNEKIEFKNNGGGPTKVFQLIILSTLYYCIIMLFKVGISLTSSHFKNFCPWIINGGTVTLFSWTIWTPGLAPAISELGKGRPGAARLPSGSRNDWGSHLWVL